MAETRASNPLVDQFRKGGVPKELRLMAAQGALLTASAEFTTALRSVPQVAKFFRKFLRRPVRFHFAANLVESRQVLGPLGQVAGP